MNEDTLLTTKQAAAELGYANISGVIRLIQSGRLPATRFGKAYQVRAADLDAVRTRKLGRPPNSANRPKSHE